MGIRLSQYRNSLSMTVLDFEESLIEEAGIIPSEIISPKFQSSITLLNLTQDKHDLFLFFSSS